MNPKLLLLTAALTSVLAAQTALTATTPAEDLAAQWSKASAKYDIPRATLLAEVDRQARDGKFRPNWQSLSSYELPDWYKDAKFGIFIHWGLYAVPAFGSEWYPREMYIEGSEINKHHVATFGPLTKFGYKDFIPQFKAESYDPDAWTSLFKAAGAKYVVPVFEHHDGFAMYDSGLSDWTAVKMGPKRDLAGELATAVRKQGLHLGASSHRIEHDWFLDHGRLQASDVNDPQYAAFYGPAQTRLQDTGTSGTSELLTDFTYVSPRFTDDWVARNAEIVGKYKPEIIFFDWWIGQPAVRESVARFAAFYYNESAKRGPTGIISYKNFDMQQTSGLLDIERGQLAEIRSTSWQTDTSVSNKSWGYIENDTFKTPAFIIHQLVDVVSKNGNLLLNIGPRADGTIPDEVQKVLLSVGIWLRVNGDAIYGTRPWKVYGEGPTRVQEGAFHDTGTEAYTAEDFRFTTKGPLLYASEFAWPATNEAIIHALAPAAGHIQTLQLLGSDEKLTFTQKADGLHITLPAKPFDQPAYTFRITFAR